MVEELTPEQEEAYKKILKNMLTSLRVERNFVLKEENKRVCTYCGKPFSISVFSPSGQFCGLLCSRKHRKQYYETNKEKIKEYYETNKNKILAQQKKYYENNKEKIKETKKKYHKTNKEKLKEYYETNKEKLKEYREANKKKIKEYNKKYYEANKDKILAKKKIFK